MFPFKLFKKKVSPGLKPGRDGDRLLKKFKSGTLRTVNYKFLL